MQTISIAIYLQESSFRISQTHPVCTCIKSGQGRKGVLRRKFIATYRHATIMNNCSSSYVCVILSVIKKKWTCLSCGIISETKQERPITNKNINSRNHTDSKELTASPTDTMQYLEVWGNRQSSWRNIDLRSFKVRKIRSHLCIFSIIVQKTLFRLDAAKLIMASFMKFKTRDASETSS